ncbi:MAG TPA: nucleotidyltransferase family protein [Opitutaceae bacterium]|nr:nucleotidyltransferase family protein [Opitutaceae bacterium]
MRALLLAGGIGTRLRPLTDYLPKCLVPIHGRPLIDYWLELLLSQGVSEVLVNTHYLAPLVAEFLQRCSWSDRVSVVHEERLLGTAGTILANRSFFRDERFLVAHADNLTRFDVRTFALRHASRPLHAEMTMMLFKVDNPSSCGIVELDHLGVVHQFHEKVASPPGNLANAAVYILEPTVVDFLEKFGRAEIDFSIEVIPNFLGKIFTFLNTDYHRDIGTMGSWLLAQRDFPFAPISGRSEIAWTQIIERDNGHLSRMVIELLTPSPPTAPLI